MADNYGPHTYGRYYWCIKTAPGISDSDEIYVYADNLAINKHGDLLARRLDKHGETSINLALAAGQWRAYYIASVLDGSAVAVEHWPGEVVR